MGTQEHNQIQKFVETRSPEQIELIFVEQSKSSLLFEVGTGNVL